MALPVLVVDDSTLARKFLIQSLPSDWDIEVTQATNGADALVLCRQGKADIMFLDLTMPGMTGFQVLEAIRAESLQSFVIVVSADVQPEAQARVRAAGARAFIQKPATGDKLSAVLKEHGLHG